MQEIIRKNDFIEIEYTGRTAEGGVFDSTILAEAKKLNPDVKEVKPFIICIGQNMILPAIDEFLIDKEIDKSYTLELSSDKAFGSRDRKLVKTMPISVFSQQKINPMPGMVFSFDNLMGKVISNSGGRIIVDFNNPLAGKNVIYTIKTKRKIEDINEKVKVLMQRLFKIEFEFTIKDKKLIIRTEQEIGKFLDLFKPKFKEILDLDLGIEEKPSAQSAERKP